MESARSLLRNHGQLIALAPQITGLYTCRSLFASLASSSAWEPVSCTRWRMRRSWYTAPPSSRHRTEPVRPVSNIPRQSHRSLYLTSCTFLAWHVCLHVTISPDALLTSHALRIRGCCLTSVRLFITMEWDYTAKELLEYLPHKLDWRVACLLPRLQHGSCVCRSITRSPPKTRMAWGLGIWSSSGIGQRTTAWMSIRHCGHHIEESAV